MQLSIIIPAWNEAVNIKRCIHQAFETDPLEVIVVDGGSHDDTKDIARLHGATVIHAPLGRATQQNAGADAASGDWLLFVHADNFLPAAAGRQIEQAAANGVHFGGFRQEIHDDHWCYRWLERGNALRIRRGRLPFGDQGIFMRRDLFDRIGGFPNVRLMEDVELMRAARAYGRPALLEGPLQVSARRWQQHGIVRQTIRNWALLAARFAGVHPNRLADWYRNDCREKRESTTPTVVEPTESPTLAKSELQATA